MRFFFLDEVAAGLVVLIMHFGFVNLRYFADSTDGKRIRGWSGLEITA